MNQDLASKPGKKIQLTCDCGCGTIFYRYRHRISDGGTFFNREHLGVFRLRKYLRDQCGLYLPLFTEYLEGAADQKYRNTKNIRSLIRSVLSLPH